MFSIARNLKPNKIIAASNRIIYRSKRNFYWSAIIPAFVSNTLHIKTKKNLRNENKALRLENDSLKSDLQITLRLLDIIQQETNQQRSIVDQTLNNIKQLLPETHTNEELQKLELMCDIIELQQQKEIERNIILQQLKLNKEEMNEFSSPQFTQYNYFWTQYNTFWMEYLFEIVNSTNRLRELFISSTITKDIAKIRGYEIMNEIKDKDKNIATKGKQYMQNIGANLINDGVNASELPVLVIKSINALSKLT
eukprot:444295_1